MDANTIRKLIDTNHQFYQSYAHSFSLTRQRVQPGVQKLLQSHEPVFADGSLLDLGCGNADLIPALKDAHFSGKYFGLDFSANLLNEKDFIENRFPVEFIKADITNPDWHTCFQQRSFDAISCFAVLHHIPDVTVREEILKAIHTLLKADGLFMFSVWQFQRSVRLARRIQPWEKVGLMASQVDDGDYLLDWRGAGEIRPAYRYVHVYDRSELDSLCDRCHFNQVEYFSSDGREGNLSDYQVWKIR